MQPFVHCPLLIYNQMASTLSQSFKNLPANDTEISALKKLLDGDLEHRSFILRKQEQIQVQHSYAKKAAEVFADCLATTTAVKEAYATSMRSLEGLRTSLNNALNLYDGCEAILATISSTKAILATWTETVALTEKLLMHLDETTIQVETHLRMAAGEQAAHETAHQAASESLLHCTNFLDTVDQSIAEKKGALFGLRFVPTEILPQIFMEAVDARQREIINSLSSYFDAGKSYYDFTALSTTLNLVPFTLSATCKRWRAICQATPQLWRYARMPMLFNSSKIIGKAQFERCVLLAENQPLELTVYPCYDVTHQGATYPNVVLPPESQILRVNIVWYKADTIPHRIPSPVELCIVASADSPGYHMRPLPSELLVNTKRLRYKDVIPWYGVDRAGLQSLRIVLSRSGALPQIHYVLQHFPQLQELFLQINAAQSIPGCQAFTLPQLHTLSLTALAIPWVVSSFSSGWRLPRLARLVLIDINGSPSPWNTPDNSGQFSRITHIEVHAVSAPSVVAEFRPLFEVSTALCTTTLAGNAVEPMMKLLTLPTAMRVEKIILRDSDADGTTLRDYLVAISENGRGTSGMKVVWKDCPNFSGEYGKASGELHL